MSPNERLWFALLMLSVYDAIGITPYLTPIPEKDQADVKDARSWILNEERNRAVPSFIWVCEILEIDFVSIRDFVKKAMMIKPSSLCTILMNTMGGRVGLHKVYMGRNDSHRSRLSGKYNREWLQ